MPDPHASLRLAARRFSRVTDEADDLLQDALLEAVRVGRADVSLPANYAWVVGTMKNLAAMTARGAVRRRLREERWGEEQAEVAAIPAAIPAMAAATRAAPDAWCSHPALVDLPPSLRQVALLALSGHDRREIAWLLRLSDTALRKRISDLRKRLAAAESASPPSASDGVSQLPLGLIRRALLPVVRVQQSAGTHDPDGHLVIFGAAHKSAPRGNQQ